MIVDESAVRAVQITDEISRRLFLDLCMLPRNESQILRNAQIRFNAAPDNDPVLFNGKLVRAPVLPTDLEMRDVFRRFTAQR